MHSISGLCLVTFTCIFGFPMLAHGQVTCDLGDLDGADGNLIKCQVAQFYPTTLQTALCDASTSIPVTNKVIVTCAGGRQSSWMCVGSDGNLTLLPVDNEIPLDTNVCTALSQATPFPGGIIAGMWPLTSKYQLGDISGNDVDLTPSSTALLSNTDGPGLVKGTSYDYNPQSSIGYTASGIGISQSFSMAFKTKISAGTSGVFFKLSGSTNIELSAINEQQYQLNVGNDALSVTCGTPATQWHAFILEVTLTGFNAICDGLNASSTISQTFSPGDYTLEIGMDSASQVVGQISALLIVNEDLSGSGTLDIIKAHQQEMILISPKADPVYVATLESQYSMAIANPMSQYDFWGSSQGSSNQLAVDIAADGLFSSGVLWCKNKVILIALLIPLYLLSLLV